MEVACQLDIAKELGFIEEEEYKKLLQEKRPRDTWLCKALKSLKCD